MMEIPMCPLDVTYCSATDCKVKNCTAHPRVLKALLDSPIMVGATISVSDLRGTCQAYMERT